jgi:hypothetical protein
LTEKALDTGKAVALAEELGWGTSQGSDMEAFDGLLNCEFERLGSTPRRTFADQIQIKCPNGLGSDYLICAACQDVVLSKYRPDNGRCRVCSAELEGWGEGAGDDSGFGFVLSQYGASREASIVNPAAGGDLAAVWEVAGGRLGRKMALDAENEDWDEIQDEIEAKREREASEREARRAKAEAERAAALAKEEAEREAREAKERAEREAREAKERAEAEKTRPAFGCVLGPRAGNVVRIPDLGDEATGNGSAVWIKGGNKNPVAWLLAEAGSPAFIDGVEQAAGEHQLELGALIRLGEEVYALEETQEMDGIVAEAVHFARADKKPGGPWSYWNDEVQVGASHSCQVNVVDDVVADVHARVMTRFGQIVIEDLSPGDGLFVKGKRQESFVLTPDLEFTLAEGGPALVVKRGEAKQKRGGAAKAMKPSRHNRTVFELRHKDGKLLRKLFVFTRREVRFGSISHTPGDESRMVNELPLRPTDKELTVISEKQGGFALTRDGVEVRRDGEEAMLFNDEPMAAGKPESLKRRFTINIGEEDGMRLDGRIYRSPTSISRDDGPARLGMKGGHPVECVRFDRKKTNHTYVFLVRMLRIGSEPAAPIRLGLQGVQENHCRILFSQGKFLIVAPKEGASTFLGDLEMEPGVIYPLQINTEISIGDACLHFRVVDEDDFDV